MALKIWIGNLWLVSVGESSLRIFLYARDARAYTESLFPHKYSTLYYYDAYDDGNDDDDGVYLHNIVFIKIDYINMYIWNYSKKTGRHDDLENTWFGHAVLLYSSVRSSRERNEWMEKKVVKL